MEITYETSGSFKNTESFLKSAGTRNVRAILEQYGQRGVNALEAATPASSGLAANSWYYRVEKMNNGWAIHWSNSDVENGFHVAAMIQHGYATGTGGWVQGRDYINPTMRPIFDRITEEAWKAVNSA